MSQDPYAGIVDLDNKTIEAMEAPGYLSQFIISNLLFLVFGGGGVGYLIGLYAIPGGGPAVAVPLFWVGCAGSIGLEILYWISAYTSAHRYPWIGVVYRFGKKFWRNEFKMIDHKVIGWLDPSTGAPPKPGDGANYLKAPAAGALVVEEIRLANKYLPRIVAVMKGPLETICDFQGSSMTVMEKAFVFTVRNCTAITFTRTSFIKDAHDVQVPIGVLTDYSELGTEVGIKAGLYMPEGNQIKVAAGFYDSHYASQYYQAWKNEEGLRKSATEARANTRHSVSNEAGAVVKDITVAGTSLVEPEGRRLSKKSLAPLLVVAVIVLVVAGFFLRWW